MFFFLLPPVFKPDPVYRRAFEQVAVTSLNWSPVNLSRIATGLSDGRIAVWDLSQPKRMSPLFVMQPFSMPIKSLAWSPKTPFLLASASEDEVTLVDVRDPLTFWLRRRCAATVVWPANCAGLLVNENVTGRNVGCYWNIEDPDHQRIYRSFVNHLADVLPVSIIFFLVFCGSNYCLNRMD